MEFIDIYFLNIYVQIIYIYIINQILQNLVFLLKLCRFYNFGKNYFKYRKYIDISLKLIRVLLYKLQ